MTAYIDFVPTGSRQIRVIYKYLPPGGNPQYDKLRMRLTFKVTWLEPTINDQVMRRMIAGGPPMGDKFLDFTRRAAWIAPRTKAGYPDPSAVWTEIKCNFEFIGGLLTKDMTWLPPSAFMMLFSEKDIRNVRDKAQIAVETGLQGGKKWAEGSSS